MKKEEKGSDIYIRNPDVVLREEDADGGLLFNPDTNQIKVINSTGLFIWEKCDGGLDLGQVIKLLKESFDGVPEDQVDKQAKKFLNELIASGFIGILEE